MSHQPKTTDSIDSARLVTFTQELVRSPSLSGQEQGVAACVQAEMRRLGFDRIEVDAYGSVIGVIEGAAAGPTLLFDPHTDTVGLVPGVP